MTHVAATTAAQQRPRFIRIAVGVQIVAVPCIIGVLSWIAFDRSEALKPKGSHWLLFLALLALEASLLCFAARLRFSLRALGVQLPLKTSMLIALQSLFYFFIPLSIGTDAVRWMKIQTRLPEVSRTVILTAVLFDRATAAVACLIIGLATLRFVESVRVEIPWPTGGTQSGLLIAAAVLLTVSALAVTVVLARRHRHQLSMLCSRRFAANACIGLVLSIFTQGFTILTIWSSFQWIGLGLDPAGIAFGVTGGALAQVIPLSLAGAGPSEVTAGFLSAAAGATTEQAVLLASMVYFCKLICGIEGGLLEWPPIARRIRV